jgi:hypothetical protein
VQVNQDLGNRESGQTSGITSLKDHGPITKQWQDKLKLFINADAKAQRAIVSIEPFLKVFPLRSLRLCVKHFFGL